MLNSNSKLTYLDFNKSSIGWKLINGSVGLFKVDSMLTIKNTNKNFYLAKTVMAGNVYGKKSLPIYPNSHYQCIISETKRKVIRLFANNKIKINSVKDPRVENYLTNIKLKRKKRISILDIINSKKFFHNNLICVLELKNQTSIFDIKHINLDKKNKKFQIETGPILLNKEKKLTTAFIFFNSENRSQIVWNYPKLGSKKEELQMKSNFFIDA